MSSRGPVSTKRSSNRNAGSSRVDQPGATPTVTWLDSKIVLSSSYGPAGGAEDSKYQSNDEGEDPEDPHNMDGSDETDDEQHNSENDQFLPPLDPRAWLPGAKSTLAHRSNRRPHLASALDAR